MKKLDRRTKAYKDSIKNKAPKGLGDVVEAVTKATGIKKLVEVFTPEGVDCGCDKRKKDLNLSVELGRHTVLRCMTEQQYNDYGAFMKARTLTIERPQVKYLTDLYAHVFAMQYPLDGFCSNCGGSAKRLATIQKRLDKVYNSYERK